MGKPTERDVNFKNPGAVTVRLALFWVTNYVSDTSQRALDRAREMLNDHGLGLEARSRAVLSEKAACIPSPLSSPRAMWISVPTV